MKDRASAQRKKSQISQRKVTRAHNRTNQSRRPRAILIASNSIPVMRAPRRKKISAAAHAAITAEWV